MDTKLCGTGTGLRGAGRDPAMERHRDRQPAGALGGRGSSSTGQEAGREGR